MKINSIKISNILSFEHHDDIEKGDDISFVDDINVIIGPMGSGKSNFLEIVNRLFKSVLIQEWIYNENALTNYDTTQNALETEKTGQTSTWTNPDTGHSGEVTPTRTYTLKGQPCRDFTQTIYVDGSNEDIEGTACREEDGIWRPKS